MLPKQSRCILGLEEEAQRPMQAGERDAENLAQRRQRRRFNAMWAGAEPLFERFLPVEPSPAAAAAAPQSQRNFAPASCVDLLRSLPSDPQSRFERRLRDNTLMLISSYLEQDQAIARTVPRNGQRRARVAPPPVVASDDSDASASDDSDASSSDDSDASSSDNSDHLFNSDDSFPN